MHDRLNARRGRQHGDGDIRRRHHPEGSAPSRHLRGEGRGRGRGRAQRGDVRAAVLLLLADKPMHGYQLMQAIVDRTEGAWRPSPGAIYPTIAQLEDEGLVTVTPDAGRKLVALSETGKSHLANASTAADPFTAITELSGGRQDLRGAVEQLHAAARAVGQSGTDSQIAAAQEILVGTRRALYLILADTSADPLVSNPNEAPV